MWNFSSQGIRAPSRHHETGDWWFRRPGGFPESGSADVGLLRLLRADHRRVGLSAARRHPLHQLSGPDSELYRRPRMVSSLTRSRGQFETRGPWFESGTDTSPQCSSKDRNPESEKCCFYWCRHKRRILQKKKLSRLIESQDLFIKSKLIQSFVQMIFLLTPSGTKCMNKTRICKYKIVVTSLFLQQQKTVVKHSYKFH